jgi:hypothetical protein
MYFNPSQISIAGMAFAHAEKMVARHYRLREADLKNLRYDVKTQAFLEEHEVSESAFAHLCRYHYQREQEATKAGGFYFYKICLQDNRILDAVDRAGSFIKLPPLLLYIATHELVHVIRFDAGEGNFDVTIEEKEQEEQRVHIITRQMLSPFIYPDLKIVLDCFSDRHTIGDLFN